MCLELDWIFFFCCVVSLFFPPTPISTYVITHHVMFGIVIKNAGRRKEMLYNFTLRKKEDKGLGQTRAVCFAASMRWRERV